MAVLSTTVTAVIGVFSDVLDMVLTNPILLIPIGVGLMFGCIRMVKGLAG